MLRYSSKRRVYNGVYTVGYDTNNNTVECTHNFLTHQQENYYVEKSKFYQSLCCDRKYIWRTRKILFLVYLSN